MRKLNQIKIGKEIKKLRLSKGYTQKELASKIGVTTRYISDIEQDRSNASYDVLIKICNLFKVSLDELFSNYLDVSATKDFTYSISGAIDYLKKIKV